MISRSCSDPMVKNLLNNVKSNVIRGDTTPKDSPKHTTDSRAHSQTKGWFTSSPNKICSDTVCISLPPYKCAVPSTKTFRFPHYPRPPHMVRCASRVRMRSEPFLSRRLDVDWAPYSIILLQFPWWGPNEPGPSTVGCGNRSSSRCLYAMSGFIKK